MGNSLQESEIGIRRTKEKWSLILEFVCLPFHDYGGIFHRKILNCLDPDSCWVGFRGVLKSYRNSVGFLGVGKQLCNGALTCQLCIKVLLGKSEKYSLTGLKSELTLNSRTVFFHFWWYFVHQEGVSLFFQLCTLAFLNLYCKFSITEIFGFWRFN